MATLSGSFLWKMEDLTFTIFSGTAGYSNTSWLEHMYSLVLAIGSRYFLRSQETRPPSFILFSWWFKRGKNSNPCRAPRLKIRLSSSVTARLQPLKGKKKLPSLNYIHWTIQVHVESNETYCFQIRAFFRSDETSKYQYVEEVFFIFLLPCHNWQKRNS